MSTEKLQVLQVTDTHLFGSAQAALMGVNTLHTFDSVLNVIRNNFNHADSMVITGDLSQDGSPESYHFLKDRLATLNMPNYWLCGNHDQPELMHSINPDAMQKVVSLGSWQIILLNSHVANEVHGYLSPTELNLLNQALTNNPDKHSLIALHHHPTAINSQWMDDIKLHNTNDLGDILEQHNNIKGIIHGHIHQDIEYSFCGIPVMATPSTCVQFAPKSDRFRVDAIQPGFRVLDLYIDGTFDNQVIRVRDIPSDIDLHSSGY